MPALADLRPWLAARGFTVFNSLATKCGWDSYRPAADARPCELARRPSIHVTMSDVIPQQVDVLLSGECDGVPYRLRASLSPWDLDEQLTAVEARLVRVWNALTPETACAR